MNNEALIGVRSGESIVTLTGIDRTEALIG